jgi:anti-sigma factor RsiW
MRAVDTYAEWDAAYVLGALSSDERREFEDHLSACSACQAAVAEFAGMPGLLGRVPAGEVLALDLGASDESGPAGPEGPVLAQGSARVAPPVRLGDRLRRRRGWAVPFAVAASALAIGAAGGYAVSSTTRPASPPPAASGHPGQARLAFSAVQPSGMTAVVDVVRGPASTQFRVECQYARDPAHAESGAGGRDYSSVEYAIWVVDRAGHATELKAWTARPGIVMHPNGATALPYASIAAVEIRQVDGGQTVMRAALT